MRSKIGLGLKPVVRYYSLRVMLSGTRLLNVVRGLLRLA